jgi:hypothetical protein
LRTISLALVFSVWARVSSAARSSGSSRTGNTSAAVAPSDGLAGRRLSLAMSWPASASLADVNDDGC